MSTEVASGATSSTSDTDNNAVASSPSLSPAAEGRLPSANQNTIDPVPTTNPNSGPILGLRLPSATNFDAGKLANEAKSAASTFASFAFTYAVKVKQKLEEASKDLDRRRDEFLVNESAFQFSESREARAIAEQGILPWQGVQEEEELKKQILGLSLDKRNFLMDPPDGSNFQFDMDVAFPTALAILKVDKMLETMRFELVPKQIKDPIFWRNYFYRVHLLKNAATLRSLGTSAPTTHPTTSSTQSSPVVVVVPPLPSDIPDDNNKMGDLTSDLNKDDEEFVSDDYGVSADEDWEKQLQEELQDD